MSTEGKSEGELMNRLVEKNVLFRRLVKSIPSTTYGTFALYRYPAKFIPHVIAYELEKYASLNTTIFDPFAGYGTAGIVARVYGYNYELWDLNPLLEVFHRVATLEYKPIKVGQILSQMANSKEEFWPKWSRLNYWFAEEFLPMLTRAWGFYHSLEDGYIKDILIIPLLKVTRYFSYDDIQRQKLSKSPKSNRRIESLKSGDWKVRFYILLRNELNKLLRKIEQYQKLSPKHVKCNVKGGIDTLTTQLEKERDILITSPPYLQSHEYIRQAKMDLFWLGYSEMDVRELSKLEIPYRNVGPITIYSETFHEWRDKLKEEKEQIRKVFDNYFWGVLGALTRLQDKITSYLCLFVGRPSLRGESVPIDVIFAEHFTGLGWKHEITLKDKIVARRLFSYKVNPATNKEDKRTQQEYLVVLRKL